MKLFSVNDQNVVLDGYDVVAYHKGNARRGSSEWSTEFCDLTFWFSSSDHLSMFLENPEAYTPQYGGYCSFGIGFGQLAPADPATFLIDGNKLYLLKSPMVKRFWRWFGKPKKSESQWQKLKMTSSAN